MAEHCGREAINAMRAAVAFLDDLEASENHCTHEDNPQAATFYMVRADLERALKALQP